MSISQDSPNLGACAVFALVQGRREGLDFGAVFDRRNLDGAARDPVAAEQ